MTIQSSIACELSFMEMLSDPIVQTVMACDGVTRRDLEDLIRAARVRSLVRRGKEQEISNKQFRAVASGG